MSSDAKLVAWQAIDEVEPEARRLALDILRNPELGNSELLASSWLVESLAQRGFAVIEHYCGLDTAFLARYVSGTGPVVAVCAEYDALPEVGHGCGHNLIAGSAFAAGVGVAEAMKTLSLNGEIRVVGTPAEEVPDARQGKVLLLSEGAFDDVDVALEMHPYPDTLLVGGDNGIIIASAEFKGASAHAADDPWHGRNALDGVIGAFNGIAALRQQLHPQVRVHGIIRDGGQAFNIIHERAAAEFACRAPRNALLEETWARVEQCIRGAAVASGTEVDVRVLDRIESTKPNRTLHALMAEAMADLGIPCPAIPAFVAGSTDFGNVTRRIPSAWFMMKTHPAGVAWHSATVAAQAGDELALAGMMQAAKVLSAVALELMMSPAALAAVKADFVASDV